MCNEVFVHAVIALKEMPDADFSKKQFEDVAGKYLVGFSSASTIFEHLRSMGLVEMSYQEDMSVVFDRWGDPKELTDVQYNALPDCVRDALNWKISPRCRNWYRVNHLAVAQEIEARKEQLSKDFRMLDLL